MIRQSDESTHTDAAILLSAEKGLLVLNRFLQDMLEKMVPIFQSCRKFLEEEKLREEELLGKAERALAAFRGSSVCIPNPFNIAGFSPNEDAWSNALAVILDPLRSRGLELKPLEEIVKTIAEKGTKNKEDAMRIKKILGSYQGTISVTCRVHCGDTIPDIVVRGKGFLIYIETKMRWGSETVDSEERKQTKRQADNLAMHSKREGVNTLGILLSPTGRGAASRKFYSLSGHELADAIRKAIQGCEPDYEGKLLMEAFIDTFQLLY